MIANSSDFLRLVDDYGLDVPQPLLRPYRDLFRDLDDRGQFEFLLAVADRLGAALGPATPRVVERAAHALVDWFLLPARGEGVPGRRAAGNAA